MQIEGQLCLASLTELWEYNHPSLPAKVYLTLQPMAFKPLWVFVLFESNSGAPRAAVHDITSNWSGRFAN
jgi:hypothetical protein